MTHEVQLLYPPLPWMARLRLSMTHGSSEIIEPLEILAPFLTLLHAPYLSGPFKLVALDALRSFMCSNLLSDLPSHTGDALARVVDAVTRYVRSLAVVHALGR